MLIKHSLGLILINVLETCTTVSKRTPIMLWMICWTFLHWTCHRNSFVEKKRQIWSSTSALPYQWCSISLTVLLISSIGIKELLTCSIIWLPKYNCHTIRWLNKILNICCCFVVDFLTRFLFMNKTCFSRYSENVRAYNLYDVGPQIRMWVTVVNPIGMG